MVKKKEINARMAFIIVAFIAVAVIVAGIYNNKAGLSPDDSADSSTLEEPEPYGCSVGGSPACCVCNGAKSGEDNNLVNEYCSLTDAQANCATYCSSQLNGAGVKEIRNGPCFDTTNPSANEADFCCRCPGQNPSTKRGYFALAAQGLNTLCGCTGTHSSGAC